MITNIDRVASNIMLDAYKRGGSFNRHHIGYGYEDLEEKEKPRVLEIIETYGETRDTLPGSWYFSCYQLNDKGTSLHEEHRSYIHYLQEKEQEERDKALDREAKITSIETSREANRIAQEANRIACKAIKKSFYANIIAIIAGFISLLSVIVSIITLIKQ